MSIATYRVRTKTNNLRNMHFADERSVISPHLSKTNKHTSDVRRLISKCIGLYTPFIWYVIMQWRMFYGGRCTQRGNRARNVWTVAMLNIQHCVVYRKLYDRCRMMHDETGNKYMSNQTRTSLQKTSSVFEKFNLFVEHFTFDIRYDSISTITIAGSSHRIHTVAF